jgi:hypothetical protein
MRLIALLTTLFFSLNSLAAFTPISIKGQADGSKSTVTNLQVASKHATQVAPSTYLLETNNKNLLTNPGFEHSTPSTGWTTAVTSTATAALTVTSVGGYPGENQYGLFTCDGNASGGTCSIKQEVTTLAGSQGLISALLRAQAGAPSASMTVYTLVNGTRVTSKDITNTGSTAFWDETFNVPEVSSGTSLGIEVLVTVPASGSLAVGIDRAFVGTGNVTQPTSIITPWASYTPTLTGFGTATNVAFKWRQVGSSIEIHGRFTSGTADASEARISLPNGYTISSDITTLQSVGTHVNSISAANTHGGVVLAEPSVSYLTLSDNDVFGSSTVVPLSKATGSQALGSSATMSLTATVPIANLSGATQVFASNCGANCENDLTAFVTDGSSTTTVSRENVSDFISGNCTNGSTGNYVCTFGLTLASAPNCSIGDTSQNVIPTVVTTTTTATISFLSRADAVTAADTNFSLNCSKTGADYQSSRTLAASLKVPEDEVIVDSGNGHGSTNTKIRRWSNIRKNSGSCITYADSATAGGSFTIGSGSCAGTYTMSCHDRRTTGTSGLAITVNATAMTTNPQSPITYAQGLRALTSTVSTVTTGLSWTGILAAGDVLRLQTDGDTNSGDAQSMCSVKKVSL